MTLIFHECLWACPANSTLLGPLVIFWTGGNTSGALLAWMVCQINQITAVLAIFLVIGITEADAVLTKNPHGLSIFGVGLASKISG